MIKKRKTSLIIVYLIPILFITVSVSTSNESIKNKLLSEIKSFDFPIYPDKINLEKFSLNSGYTQGITYYLKIEYPANEIVSFYEKQMAVLEFHPFIEDYYKYSDRNWESFVDSTRKENPYIAQFMADWVDAERSKRAKLILRYYWYGKDPSSPIILTDNDNLHVVFQIMPYFTLPPTTGIENHNKN